MRVLHVEAGKHLFGGALQVHYLTERLVEFGVQSFLAAPRGAEIFSQLHPNVVPLPIKMAGDGDFGLVGRFVFAAGLFVVFRVGRSVTGFVLFLVATGFLVPASVGVSV